MRREEIEALAADYDAAANRCEEIAAREEAGGWPTPAAHHRSEAGAIKWAARMLREALAKSEARDAPEPGQNTARIPVKDVLAWEGDYMSEPHEIAIMGPGLWMAVEIAYDYEAGYATVTAYPVTPSPCGESLLCPVRPNVAMHCEACCAPVGTTCKATP